MLEITERHYATFPRRENRSDSKTPLDCSPLVPITSWTAVMRAEKLGWVLKKAWSSPFKLFEASQEADIGRWIVANPGGKDISQGVRFGFLVLIEPFIQ
jgi:hypothetical protein